MNQGLATVIGMTIAYVASFAGLLLAWIAYTRRTGGSWRGIIILCISLGALFGVMILITMIVYIQQTGGSWWGIAVPFLIFAVAFSVTLLLYRHFSKTHHE